MSARPAPSLLRTTLARLAVAGAAGLASVLVVAPVAVAAPGDTAPDLTTDTTDSAPSDAPSVTTDEPVADPADPAADPAAPTGEPALQAETPGQVGQPGAARAEAKAPEAAAQDFVPEFGTQKYRVGVKIADGSYVPAGATTVGTTFTITETGPLVPDGSQTFTCTTEASTLDGTASYCPAPEVIATLTNMSKAAAAADVEVDPTDSAPQAFVAAPGSVVTIRQATAGANLVLDPEVTTIAPCDPAGGSFGNCLGNGFGQTLQTKVLYSNEGLPPIAVDDSAKTREGTAVDIDVLANDDTVNGAPLTGLDVTTDPADGTAKVKGDSVTYTPAAGFTGTDTFDYALTTANGTATATVTVRVSAAAIVTVPESAAAVISEDAVLPNTGGADPRLLGYAGLLLAGGAWLTTRGLRRPRATHGLSD